MYTYILDTKPAQQSSKSRILDSLYHRNYLFNLKTQILKSKLAIF